VRHLQHEGAVAVGLDEGDGPLGEEGGRAARPVGPGHGRRLDVAVALEHLLPALGGRAVFGTAEVPLAEVTGRIAGGCEPLGKRRRRRGQM
jgi:hypothetical protein